MTYRNRHTQKAWIWETWLPWLLLVGGLVLAGCSKKDPVEPQPVEPEPTFSVTFADGEFTAAFQTSARGGYVAAGTGADGQGFIYKIESNGTETTHYVFDQNASAEHVEDALPVTGGGYMVCGSSNAQGWVAKIDGSLQNVENNLYQGGAQDDYINAMAALSGGGFVCGGECNWDRTWSTGDGWLVKVTSAGVYESQTSFGGSARDYVLALTTASGQGFFFGGCTFPTASSDARAWICKTNAAADGLVWNKSYIYNLDTAISGLVATSDGGCMCVGSTLRMETVSLGRPDAYVLRVNASGDKLWSNSSGIDGADYYYSVVRAHDGGYVCAGWQYTAGNGWLVKIDDNGNTVWQKTFAGGQLYSIKQTSGNGYVCSGKKDGKAWLLRVDVNGDFEE